MKHISKKSPFFFFLLIFFMKVSSLPAFELKVEIKNASKNNIPERIGKLELLKLEGGMQLIRTIKNPKSLVHLENLEAPTTSPYMLQATHQGILYSKVVPPNTASGSKIALVVYDIQNEFKNIDLNVLYVIKYVQEHLRFLVFLKFENESQKTFTEKENGIYTYIPKEATQIQASVSVGSGLSNIQWLKLSPQKTETEDSLASSESTQARYLLPYPVKPAQKIYQISYYLPYHGDKKKIPLEFYYPVKSNIELLLETKDLNLLIEEAPLWKPSANVNTKEKATELPGNLVKLPLLKGKMNLLFSGGTPSQEEIQEIGSVQPSQNNEVRIASPLSFFQKAVYACIALGFFCLLTFYLTRKPDWLSARRLREKSIVQYQLANLESLFSNDGGTNDVQKKQKQERLRQKLRRKLMYLNSQ